MRDQFHLLVGERSNLLAKEVEGADQLALLQQRDAENGSDTSGFDACYLRRAAVLVGGFRLRIEDLNRLPRCGHAREPRPGTGPEHRIAPPILDKGRRACDMRSTWP